MRQELEANGQARIDRWIPLGMSVMTAPEPLRGHDLRFYGAAYGCVYLDPGMKLLRASPQISFKT